MKIVADTSAFIAILQKEQDAGVYRQALLEAEKVFISHYYSKAMIFPRRILLPTFKVRFQIDQIPANLCVNARYAIKGGGKTCI